VATIRVWCWPDHLTGDLDIGIVASHLVYEIHLCGLHSRRVKRND
jgi:hypothetical protein